MTDQHDNEGVTESLLGAEVVVGRADLAIDRALLDLHLGRNGCHIVADRRRAVLRLPGIASFAVHNGERVVVELAEGAHATTVDAWLKATVTALLLAQRGHFALHANLVEVAGVAVAVAGDRGAGKTTTSLRLAQDGHVILGDDVVPLYPRGDEVIYHTTGRPLHVDRGAAAVLGLDLGEARPLAADGDKRLLPQRTFPPGRLSHVVVLSKAGVDSVQNGPLRGAEAVRGILTQAYRVALLSPLWRTELFAWAAAIAACVPVTRVQRPENSWTADAVAGSVQATLRRPRTTPSYSTDTP